MAFTYLILNSVFVAIVLLLLQRSLRRPSSSWWVTLFGVLLLTLIFDNIMIMAGLFSYHPEKILQLMLGFAPIEDFFYAVLACVLVPTFWHYFEPKIKGKS